MIKRKTISEEKIKSSINVLYEFKDPDNADGISSYIESVTNRKSQWAKQFLPTGAILSQMAYSRIVKHIPGGDFIGVNE